MALADAGNPFGNFKNYSFTFHNTGTCQQEKAFRIVLLLAEKVCKKRAHATKIGAALITEVDEWIR